MNNVLSVYRDIYCCGCGKEVKARLTDGRDIYPHRQDLYSLPFWKCETCNNYVGCHHKTQDRQRPLGIIPTPEVKAARQKIHAILDPLWKKKIIGRGKLYSMISKKFGREYHTAELRSVEEANIAYEIISCIAREIEK